METPNARQARQVIFQGSGTLRITVREGYNYVAIQNDSGSGGVVTIEGSNDAIGGANATAMTLAAGQDFTFGDGENVIEQLTISCPGGTTMRVVGVKSQLLNSI